jgi:calcineurin-like phosphoesterase family protein
MNTYLTSDTHLNHANIETYCKRPSDFTERIIRNWQRIVKPEDIIIHVGDVFIGKHEGWDAIWPSLPGKKWLIRGNHDKRSYSWWCEHGFDFCADAIIYRRAFITHKPSQFLPGRCDINIHGHLHNIWHGFHKDEPDTERITKSGRLKNPWQRLFAIEYTDYCPIQFEKFVSHPDQFQARGPAAAEKIAIAEEYARQLKEKKRQLRLENHVCKPECRCPKAVEAALEPTISQILEPYNEYKEG